jgi:hypothetical protein
MLAGDALPAGLGFLGGAHEKLPHIASDESTPSSGIGVGKRDWPA